MTAPCRLNSAADCPGTGPACPLSRASCPGPVDLSAKFERGDRRQGQNGPAEERETPKEMPCLSVGTTV